MPTIEFFGFSYAATRDAQAQIEKNTADIVLEEPMRLIVHKTDVVDMQGISRPFIVLATALSFTNNRNHDRLISALRAALPETDIYTKRYQEFFPGGTDEA